MFVNFPFDWPRWAYMWLLAMTIYFACKLLTLSGANSEQAPSWRRWAYLLAWPGMDPARFFAVRSSRLSEQPNSGDWIAGVINMVAGAVIFWNASSLVPPESPLLLG